MHATIAQSFTAICTAAAVWLMVRAGAAKGVLRIRVESRCAACGRRRVHGHCPCTR